MAVLWFIEIVSDQKVDKCVKIVNVKCLGVFTTSLTLHQDFGINLVFLNNSNNYY